MADGSSATGRPERVPMTIAFAVGAVVAALVALVNEDRGDVRLTALGVLLGLVPWALVAGGVAIPIGWFAALTILPASFAVVVGESPGAMFAAILAVSWVFSATGRLGVLIPTLAVPAAAIGGLTLRGGSGHDTGLVYFLGGLGVAAFAGTMVRRQAELLAEVETMHRQRLDHAAAAERTRIARDVHDVVAHSLTVVMLHLTGARRALSTDPDRAAAALEKAEHVGRESLDSIRHVVGLLREGEPDDPTAVPLPDARDLPALLQGYRAAGLEVDADLDDEVTRLDPATQLVVYRVVQESLANVLQHAGGVPARVSVDVTGEQVEVEIRNGAPRAGVAAPSERHGLGVRGMYERARSVGGRLLAGATADGGWEVVASLPRRSDLDLAAGGR